MAKVRIVQFLVSCIVTQSNRGIVLTDAHKQHYANAQHLCHIRDRTYFASSLNTKQTSD